MSARVVRCDGLVFVLQHREVTAEDAHAIVRAFLKINERGRPYLVLSDARGVAPPSAKVRHILGSANNPEASAKNQGRVSAVLMDSVLLRGALTSLSWFLRDAVIKPFDSAAAALPFLERYAAEQATVLTDADRTCLQSLDELWNTKRPSLELSAPRA